MSSLFQSREFWKLFILIIIGISANGIVLYSLQMGDNLENTTNAVVKARRTLETELENSDQ
ncbi:MAG: hypothetical protein A3H59_00165 [Candidatus Jacksonbacteria bacterium RIFCSPLOWO2_02_FULL_43_9]|nr:MAG: hypothetical protein UV70_C0010G0005 [Parcubacteria group bacterium GW2011_GWA2_43_13]OGY74028.1 MAG: hypothetical protein A3H59_00165 [Candidatus Jacksonbacteria bacterium RIFCSPLOWO2_02_FULL_43_9]HLC95354.1 hypothetical protein [Patescibacteria group bacterium]